MDLIVPLVMLVVLAYAYALKNFPELFQEKRRKNEQVQQTARIRG